MPIINTVKNILVSKATNELNKRIGRISTLGDIKNATGSVRQDKFSKLSENPFKNKVLSFPEELGSAQQGHYIMFYINEQENAKLNFGSFKPLTAGQEESQGVKLRLTASKNKGLVLDRPPTKRLNTSIALYMPAQINTSQGVKYGEQEIGAMVTAAMAAYKAYESSGGGLTMDAFKATMGAAGDKIGESLVEGAKSFADTIAPGAKTAIDLQQGRIVNNRMETMFEGLDKRSFQFSFKFMPKSEDEAKRVDEIVNAFRFYMLPEIMKSDKEGAGTSRKFSIPATFDIEFMDASGQNEYINKISTCVLTQCDVVYGGERVQFFRPTTGGKNGSPPVETSITLSFTEMELVDRQRVLEGY